MPQTRLKRRLAAVGVGSVLGLAALAILATSGTFERGYDAELAGGEEARIPTAPAPDAGETWIPEDVARAVFNLDREGENFVYDPVAGLRTRANRVSTWTWEEHPDGEFVQETNDISLIEREPVGPKRGPRVLVAGDSHTAGIVGTDENFSNVLEKLLGDDPGWETSDVLNAGCAYTGPRCYRGTFEKYLYLEPDVFIAVLFVGNDFFDDLYLDYRLKGERYPFSEGEYKERILRASERFPNPIFQGFNLAFRWLQRPEDRERSFALIVDSYEKMAQRCAEEGVRFLAVVLPTKMEVDSDDQAKQEWLLETLAMTREDLHQLNEIGDRFVAAMQERGIPCLDPRPAMRAAEEPLYWRQDYHLGVRGHRLLAQLLEQELVGAQ